MGTLIISMLERRNNQMKRIPVVNSALTHSISTLENKREKINKTHKALAIMNNLTCMVRGTNYFYSC